MRKLTTLSLILLVALTYACAGADLEEADGNHAATETAAGDDMAAMEHDHGDPEPGAAVDERAVWSKPYEVYEFVGIKAGDTVVDLLAGGGYNTLKVAEVVGADGLVIAERGRPELKRQIEAGEVEAAAPIQFIGWIDELQPNTVDAVLSIRAYHLFEDVPASLAMLKTALKPGGVVGVVDIRLNEDYGHNMETHRVGDQTVMDDFVNAGFEFVGSSDMLRIDDDDYTIFVPEGRQRYQTDRLLMKFRKPAE